MNAVYLTVFVIGAVGVVSALIAETGHGAGLPFLSLTTLAAALLGAGIGGLISVWDNLAAPRRHLEDRKISSCLR